MDAEQAEREPRTRTRLTLPLRTSRTWTRLSLGLSAFSVHYRSDTRTRSTYTTSMAAPAGQISLEDLSLEQLQGVKTQLEEVRSAGCSLLTQGTRLTLATLVQELQHLTNGFGDLKQAQSKFMACMEALDSIKPENKGECGVGGVSAAVFRIPANLPPSLRRSALAPSQTRRSSSPSRAPSTFPVG